MLAGSALASFSVDFTEYAGNVQFSGNTDDVYAIALIDADSQTVLYQKNFNEPVEPASTTKILTLLIALEQGNMDDVVTITASETYPTVRGSKLGLIRDEKVVFKDLINGMMMASGNDAAVAVADHMGESVDGFATMMNAKAKEIGMMDSNFVTPHGMHEEGHITTAHDMAILTLYALKGSPKSQEFKTIVSQTSYTMPADNKHSSSWTKDNTNKLIQPDETYYYQYATGIKTGSTKAAGDCLISSATKVDADNNEMNLICLMFKVEEDNPVRWTLTKDLFEWGFENFKTVDLSTLLEKADPVQATVENAAAGDSGLLEFNAPVVGEIFVTLSREAVDGILDDTDSIITEKVFDEDPLQAPIEKNQEVGTVTYKSADTGEVIYQGPLLAARGVAKQGTTPNASGATAVETQAPVEPPDLKNVTGQSADMALADSRGRAGRVSRHSPCYGESAQAQALQAPYAALQLQDPETLTLTASASRGTRFYVS